MSKVVYRTVFLTEIKKLSLILKTFHLRPVKAIKYTFDPFTENTQSLRNVMTVLNSKNILKSSSSRTKIDIKDDRCEPQMDITFSDGHQLVFKTRNLKMSDIMGKLDMFCKAKDTYQADGDMALTKMSGKPKKKK